MSRPDKPTARNDRLLVVFTYVIFHKTIFPFSQVRLYLNHTTSPSFLTSITPPSIYDLLKLQLEITISQIRTAAQHSGQIGNRVANATPINRMNCIRPKIKIARVRGTDQNRTARCRITITTRHKGDNKHIKPKPPIPTPGLTIRKAPNQHAGTKKGKSKSEKTNGL